MGCSNSVEELKRTSGGAVMSTAQNLVSGLQVAPLCLGAVGSGTGG